MSEFKFACPVCGQHITADSSTSGGQIECPTCYQKIVVPQAPSSVDTKFILSASQVAKPRPVQRSWLRKWAPCKSRPLAPQFWSSLRGCPVCAAGAALLSSATGFSNHRGQTRATTNAAASQAASAVTQTVQPIPPILWTLQLTNVVLPNARCWQHSRPRFVCERTTLEGGILSFRQGSPGAGPGNHNPPDGAPSEDLAADVGITPDRTPPLPRVVLRWKDDQQQAQKENINGGYALKIAFVSLLMDACRAKSNLCLPIRQELCGWNFSAEIRRPDRPAQAPKPKGERPLKRSSSSRPQFLEFLARRRDCRRWLAPKSQAGG